MQESSVRSSPVYRLYAKHARLGISDRIVALAIKVFSPLAKRLEQMMPTIGEDILKSNLLIAPDAFLSLLLFITFASIGVSVIAAYLMLSMNLLLLAVAIPMPAYVFGIGIMIPKMSQSSRASALDSEIAFVIGYLSVLMGGGVSPIKLFRKLSESKLYPASAREARRILTLVDVFGMNPMTAIERVARYCPNKIFSDFLAGYISVLRIGGDVNSYMEMKQREMMNYRTFKLKSTTELVGTFAEAYLAATVVLGISLFVLQAVQAMTSQAAFNLDMIMLYTGLFIPAISGAFIYIIHSAQTKEPISYMLPHYIFGASAIAIPVLYFMPLDIPVYIRLAIGFAISTSAAAVINIIESRKKQAMENILPSFINDLAEIRKTGLSPEKGIQILSNRNYGILSRSIKRMANQLSWGVPLSKVMQDFGKGVNSWFVRSIGFIMLEVVETGGGTTILFNNLAEFAQKSKELERERKSMFRPYIFLPYFGAILTIVSTVVIINMITGQISSLTEQTNTNITLFTANTTAVREMMLTATIFQAWTMGLVAGKMGEWSLAAGYKHATILALVGILTIYMVDTLVNLTGFMR
ncbi:MAG: type II secretion system F family protein [Candidatus Nitrosocaldus sp.]